jgi:hypothetical protein
VAKIQTKDQTNSFDGTLGILDPRRSHIKEMSLAFQTGEALFYNNWSNDSKKIFYPRFVLGCAGQCSIDLAVQAGLSQDFSTPYVIGSSSFITIVFTVTNLGRDPAFQPVLKIPLGGMSLKRIPSECTKIVCFEAEITN